MRLQAEELELALHAALGDAGPGGHGAHAPVGRTIVWLGAQRRLDQACQRLIVNGAYGTRPLIVVEPTTRRSPTVVMPSSRRSAIELLTLPSALLRTLPARLLRDAGNERLSANDKSCVRSSCVIIKSAFGLP